MNVYYSLLYEDLYGVVIGTSDTKVCNREEMVALIYNAIQKQRPEFVDVFIDGPNNPVRLPSAIVKRIIADKISVDHLTIRFTET